MNPYTIIGGLLLLIVVAFGGAHVGKKLEREVWREKETALLAQQSKDLAAEFQRYERMVNFNNAKSAKAAEDHEKAIAQITATHTSIVADIRRSGGLRISGAVCKAKDATATTATSAIEPDAETPGTVRIPEQVEERLFGIVEDADKLSEQLRALQKWVRDAGLYGPAKE